LRIDRKARSSAIHTSGSVVSDTKKYSNARPRPVASTDSMMDCMDAKTRLGASL
jgi:hypothetical protein